MNNKYDNKFKLLYKDSTNCWDYHENFLDEEQRRFLKSAEKEELVKNHIINAMNTNPGNLEKGQFKNNFLIITAENEYIGICTFESDKTNNNAIIISYDLLKEYEKQGYSPKVLGFLTDVAFNLTRNNEYDYFSEAVLSVDKNNDHAIKSSCLTTYVPDFKRYVEYKNEGFNDYVFSTTRSRFYSNEKGYAKTK